MEEVQKLQEIVRAVIEAKLDVERKVCDIEEALVRDEVTYHKEAVTYHKEARSFFHCVATIICITGSDCARSNLP